MEDQTLRHFVQDLYNDVVEAMDDADRVPTDPGYRLGVRRLAKAFFDKLDSFEAGPMFPQFRHRDVDAWYAGRENT